MSRDGNGTYSLPEAPFVFNTVIDEMAVNNNFSDIGSALTQSLAKDGQTVPTANLPMGNFKHTGVGNGTARNHYASVAQVQDGAVVWGGTAGGTADALTITLTPAITAYATGMTIQFIASADSTTTTPTINVNSAGVKTIVDEAGNALVAGDIANGDLYEIVYDGTNFRLKFNGSATGTAASRDVGVASGNLATVNQAVTDTASATTVTLGTTLEHNITGTTTIDAFNGVSGVKYHCTVAAALTLTHSAGLSLPTSADITTEAGDTFDVYMTDGTNSIVTNYHRRTGKPLTPTGIFRMTPVSASGTDVDFPSIPSGVNRITITFDSISINTTAFSLIQIGDAGGIENSNYSDGALNDRGGSSSGATSNTTGFPVPAQSASASLSGAISLFRMSGNKWVCSGVVGGPGSPNEVSVVGGRKELSGTLDRVRITTTDGTSVFDAGEFGLLYEF